MDEVYSQLMTVDFPDAITGGLRRRVDQFRGVLERTREVGVLRGAVPHWLNLPPNRGRVLAFAHAACITSSREASMRVRMSASLFWMDWNVPIVNSEQLYMALKRLGRTTELVVYPGEHHGIRKPSYQKDRYERYLAWYARHVKGEPEKK